jgi:hypothetical protein
MIVAATCVGEVVSAQPATTVDKVFSTQVNGRTFDMLIPKGISTVRGILFYGPGVNGDSRSALGDIGYLTKSRLFGYPILTYDKGARVVPRDANTAISNIAAQCGLAMDSSTPICAQGFSNGGGNAWSWPTAAPERTIFYFANKGVTASGLLPDAGLGIPGINLYGDQESSARMSSQQKLFSSNRARGALLALVIEQGANHGECDEYVHLYDPYLWILKEVRNPSGKLPLAPVPESSGWLADPDTRNSPMMKVYAYDNYPAGKDKRAANWLYNQDIAYTYSAFCTYNKRVTLNASPSQLLYRDSDFRDVDLPATVNKAGDSVVFAAVVDSSVGTASRIELFEYSRKLADLPANGAHAFTVKDMAHGIHNFLVLVADASGTNYISNSWTVYTE